MIPRCKGWPKEHPIHTNNRYLVNGNWTVNAVVYGTFIDKMCPDCAKAMREEYRQWKEKVR